MAELLLIVIFIMSFSAVFFRNESRLNNNFCFVYNDDSDMKIVGGLNSSPIVRQKNTDEVANEFIVQKKIGNVEKARKLGMIYAKRLLECKTAANSTKELDESPTVLEHRKVLFSYAVSHIVNESSPNSIISHTTLAVFYDEIKKDDEVYSQINNLGAISLYMLTGKKNRPTVGHVFASLCGEKDNTNYIELGNKLFNYYTKFCKKEMKKIGYIS